MGAITDRLDIRFQEARSWLGLSSSFAQISVQVLADPPASSVVAVTINDERIEAATDPDPTELEVAAAIVAAILASGQAANVTPTDNLDGTYTVAALLPATEFSIVVDSAQDLIPRVVAEDQLLVGLLDVAKVMADEYLNNDFVSYELEDVATFPGPGPAFPDRVPRKLDEYGRPIVLEELPIPAPVRTGVLQLLAYLWRNALQAQGTADPAPSGAVRTRKAGDISITYETAVEGQASGSSANVAGAIGAALPRFVASILDLYRQAPGG